jgi:hypothetical protein
MRNALSIAAVLVLAPLLVAARHGTAARGAVSSGAVYTSVVSGGTIASNTTWGPGQVYVQGDIIVAKGATLTVSPGTTVEFTGHYMLEVRGQIYARGTSPAQRDIVFTSTNKTPRASCSTPPCGWRGIRLRGDGVPTNGTYAQELGIGSPTLDQYIENAVLEYGIKLGDDQSGTAETTYGNYANWEGGCLWAYEQRKLHLNGNMFRFCSTSNGTGGEFAGAVLVMFLYPKGASPSANETLMADNDFEDNTASQNGGAIGAWHSGTTGGQCNDVAGCGAVHLLRGHFYRNTANPTGGGYRGYETDATLESVTWGTGPNANTPDDYSYNTGLMGSLTIIP